MEAAAEDTQEPAKEEAEHEKDAAENGEEASEGKPKVPPPPVAILLPYLFVEEKRRKGLLQKNYPPHQCPFKEEGCKAR